MANFRRSFVRFRCPRSQETTAREISWHSEYPRHNSAGRVAILYYPVLLSSSIRSAGHLRLGMWYMTLQRVAYYGVLIFAPIQEYVWVFPGL